MHPERIQQIDLLFQSALDLAPDQRRAFLEQECAGDRELRQEIESLLAANDQAGDFIEGSASRIASDMLAESNQEFSATGRSIGQYTNLFPLGAGGMGEVYAATDKMGRKVALKLLTARLSNDQQGVARFMREAQAVLSLNHPNIVTVYDIGKADSDHYIASELIEGQSLRERLKLTGEVEITEALDISIQVGRALVAAHEKGIIHRDIKPENIMIRPDGYVKVVDFGVAKLIEGENPAAVATDIATKMMVKTSEGMAIGSVHYMSPEQARGLPVDVRSDTWSLGVVLYEMLAGRRPFHGETVADVISSVLERQPAPLIRFFPNIPETLEWIVNKALRKDKSERYQTAGELLTDLKELRKRIEFAVEQERTDTPEGRVATVTTKAESGPSGTTEQLADPTASTGPNTTSSAEYVFNEVRQHKRGFLILAALAIVAATGAYFYFSKTDSKTINSIAVLPLINASGDPSMEYLSDGISETLINSLSRISALRVTARSTVFRYKGRETDPQKVGQELGVDAVLTGRVVQRGDNLTVQADLVNVSDGAQLWGEQYNRKMTDLVSLQREIARDVSQKLRARLSGADEQKVTKDYTANVEAYQLYLKGRYHVLKLIPSEMQAGISYFQKAIAIDPNYALAYAGLSGAYRSQALAGEMLPTEFLPKAQTAAQRALEIDETLADAHAAVGLIMFWYNWNWRAAEDHYKRALELDPNNANSNAHLSYAHLLSNTGRHAEALVEVKRARELDPLSPLVNALEGQFLIHAGRTDEAIASLQKTLELEPNFWMPHLFASSAYIEKGMYVKAVAEALKARELSPAQSAATGFASYALAKSGKRDEARVLLNELLKASTERFVPPGHIALAYNGLGDSNEALAWLERGIEQRDPKMTFLKVEPKWNNLRGDPRFQDLMRRVGF